MVYLPVELFPHLGPRRGKAAISELMDVHEARYSGRRFEVKFLVVDEARAADASPAEMAGRSNQFIGRSGSGEDVINKVQLTAVNRF